MLIYEQASEKKGLKSSEIISIIAVIVAILVAVSSLFGNSQTLPSWWFQFSLVFLILLLFSIPLIIFAKPINERIQTRNEEKKRNMFAKKHVKEFKDLVHRAREFENSIANFFNILNGSNYKSKMKSGLCSFVMESFNQNETDSSRL